MNLVAVKLATAFALALAVGACVPQAPQEDKAAEQTGAPVPAVDDPALYAARSDSNFSIPALPIEQIPAGYRRQTVAYETAEAPGTIIIDPSKRLLYFVTGKNTAIRYGIAVGAEGFGWSGTSDVTNKRHWPTWTPPKEMIERKPSLAQWEKGQPGGPTNPLGARAIYLTTNGRDYGYRIHGTPEWKSIGRNASSGCFRMINQDVMDLYERVPMGAKVVVLNRDGSYPTKLTIPPQPKKKAPPKPEATPATVVVPAPTTMPDATIPGLSTPSTTEPAAPVTTTPDASSPTAADTVAPGEAVPAPAPVLPAPVEAPAASVTTPPAASSVACTVALVNGVCPSL